MAVATVEFDLADGVTVGGYLDEDNKGWLVFDNHGSDFHLPGFVLPALRTALRGIEPFFLVEE